MILSRGKAANQERGHLFFDPVFGGLEFLDASFRTFAFDRHAHEEYVVALVLQGAETFRCRGSVHVAPRGSLYSINPGEAHDGQGVGGEGWRYQAIYPAPALLRRALGIRDPAFRRLVWQDRGTARRLAQVHLVLRSDACRLTKESALLDLLQRLVARNAEGVRQPPPGDDGRLSRVREILADHFADRHSLESLGAEAGLHPNYLLTAFRRRFGMTPVQFLHMRRLARSKQLIRRGEPLKAVAQDVGFFDQAHFARAFKQSFGVSPSAYATLTR